MSYKVNPMGWYDPLLSSISPLWALTNTVSRKVLLPRARRFSVPVLSVGNIVAGGVGKTELTAAIARRLVERGKRVVVASRGYGSEWQKNGGIAVDLATASSLRFPDEALVLLKKVPGLTVAVGADRVGILEKHWEELHPDVVLLDDGFQHFKIARDLDILVHDFSVRYPILRELPRTLSNAKVRVALSEIPERWGSAANWVKARYRLLGTRDSLDRARSLPRQAFVFCGIGNPSRFRAALTRAGVDVRGMKTYSDHARFTGREIRKLVDWHAKAGSGIPLLTSLKDYVKLGEFVESQGGIAGFEPTWVELSLDFLEGEEILWKAVDEAMAIRAS